MSKQNLSEHCVNCQSAKITKTTREKDFDENGWHTVVMFTCLSCGHTWPEKFLHQAKPKARPW